MRSQPRVAANCAIVLLTLAAAVSATTGAASASTGQSAGPLPGTRCPVFPADNYWHARVDRLPVHPLSAQWLSTMRADRTRLHPDFGPSFGEQPVRYGIPITITHGVPSARVRFEYADESDRVRYPLGPDTRIEGGPHANGDRHAIVVDADTCTLYETWNTQRTTSGWTAGSGAVWSLRSNRLRPHGWTSADAAGLPILPGLLRWDEVARGHVDHAIRFTTDVTRRAFVWPARHQAGSTNDPAAPPMGARFRLRADYPIDGYSRAAQVVLRAMKEYGLVLADNGSPWYFQGTEDERWATGLVDQLKRVPASAFEAVDTTSLMRRPGSAQTRPASTGAPT
jgi:hypothetical protein